MPDASMQAVIMAGGEGSRLRPLTSNMPKPMLPIAKRPMMEHILVLLRRHGITDVVATVQFLSSVIRNYFGDGSDLGMSLSYATEEVPLGTAGSVLGARDFLAGPFLVVSGDALTDIDLEEVVDFHRSRGAAATLVLKRMKDPLEFGIVMTDPAGRVERFLEKPTWGQVFSDTINTGIYVLEPDVLDLIPIDQPYDFSSELFPMMLDKGLPLFGFVTDAFWTDVGNTDAYLQANHDALSGRVRVDPTGFELRPGVWVGEDVEIHPTARVEGPCLVGDNVRIDAGATVGPLTVVADNAIVSDDASVTSSVLLERAQVGPYSVARGAVLGRGASLQRGVNLEEGVVLGDEVSVGAGAFIKSRVKVYPSRTVEAGAIVTQSVVKERRATRTLFGSRGVSGPVNLGVTPLVATRLGMAYGTTLKRGSVVLTGRDASRAARTMKRALIAGLNSTGVTCHDLELMPMPVTRFAVRTEQAAGGISVRTSPRDAEAVEIRLFDADGADLGPGDQRKIERIFFREDYRRAGALQLGELEFPPRTLEQYASGVMRALDVEAVRRAGLKAVVDYAYGAASVIGPSIFGRLGCDVLGLHGFIDEHRPVLVERDIDRLLDELSDQVRSSGSHAGVLLEPGGEVAHVVDDKGRVVSGTDALLALLAHEASRAAGRSVVVPVSCPQVCEEIASSAGAKLTWTSTGLAGLMAHAARPDVVFVGDSNGALMWPALMPAPDGLMTFCKVLEVMATAGRPLSAVVEDLPETAVVTVDVATPWELKGAVMRHVASQASARGGAKLVLLDGVKVVEDDRWALVIPYPDEPLCRVWAEAPTRTEAETLAGRYAALVREVVDGTRESS
ncbi:MAG: sugar phosphate nucleotidyltransferase [Actinomycetota bacterium]|nr:sugar phosphate nucleotidyltransferase [Actinomycetota bacterium]